MVDLHKQYLRLKPEIDQAISNVLESTAFIKGPQVGKFATSLSQYLGGAHVIPCGNGTDALQIALMALDLRPGDEVIVPAFTYAAAAEVVLLLRLNLVFANVDPHTFNVRPDDIRRRITKKTRAIIPVHLFGQCSDMEGILELAREHNLYVIEDAAQSLGADYIFGDGKKMKAGTMGLTGTTSFFPSKNLGGFGDGGAIFTSDPSLAARITMIANHGQGQKYVHQAVGVNSRLDTLQAAVLDVKLRHIDDFTRRRNEVANMYDRELRDVPQIRIPQRVSGSTHVFHQYTLVAERRDELKNFLKSHDVPSMIYYPIPLHLQEAYRVNEMGPGSFPESESLCRSVISLPIHTEMETGEVTGICDLIKAFYNG